MRGWFFLLGILALAAVLRIHALGVDSLWHDELWGMECTVGKDVTQSMLPLTGVLTPPPDLLTLRGAAPWWEIWTHMHGDTHPPVFHTLLRFWEEGFGTSEVAVRSMSVVFSLIAIIAFFDAVKTVNGVSPALWASLLMAVAVPQIEYAQEARSYMPLMAEGMIALAAMARIERWGMNPVRWILLMLAVLAMPLTHYFSLGAIVALMIYAGIRLRGRTLIWTGAAFFVATVLGLVLWAKQFLIQRVNFSGGLVDWLNEPSAHPAVKTLERLFLLPGRYLFDSGGPFEMAALAALVFVLPPLVFRKQPKVLLWWLWLVGTIGPVALLDFAHHSKQLAYIRYTLLAAPGVYALIATVGDWGGISRQIKWVVPAVAVLCCAVAIPMRAYHPAWRPDWRGAFATIAERRQSGEAVCCVAPGDQDVWEPDATYIELNYYLRPMPEAVTMIREPVVDLQAPRIEDLLRGKPGVWAVVSGSGHDLAWPPVGWKIDFERDYSELGAVEHLLPK